MTTTRFFLCALLLSTACISRGGGTDPPVDDASVDTTIPSDRPLSDIATDRVRRDVTCPTTTTREDTAARCNDGIDNDCNGFADCDDFACQTCAVPACVTGGAVRLRDGGTCTCGSTAENTMEACSDGVDNDCDGFFDCQDFSCQTCAVPVCLADGGLSRGDAGFCLCRGAENNNTACGDGVDNDCDGFTDCCDFDCSMTTGVTVCARDASTRTDTGPCDARGSENTNATCGDGVDNDCDGFLDCNDFDCSRTASVTVCGGDSGARCDAGGTENTNATCGDGVDNDCDGFTDCADFSCRSCAITACVVGGNITLRDGGVCMCRGEETSNTACGDGVDNDCDGFTDCADFDCTMSDGGVVTVCPRDGGGPG